MTFKYSHRVTYSECTLGNHVYYARYLDMLEAARGEFFRAAGMELNSLQAQDVIFPVLECHLKYHAPARYDDELVIELWVSQLSKIRLNVAFKIQHKEGKLLVSGETFHVCTSLEEKPKRIDAAIIEKLTPYLVT